MTHATEDAYLWVMGEIPVPVPFGAACPKCLSYSVRIICSGEGYLPLVTVEEILFNCTDCAYEFLLEGVSASVARMALSFAPPQLEYIPENN